MQDKKNELKREKDGLLMELKEIGEFRRGTVNTFYRKCGKQRCACAQEGHPGHGPQTTLTLKEKSKTLARNLPTSEAVRLVTEQIRRHDEFMDWSKRYRELNERISDLKLEGVLYGEEGDEREREKKRLRRSSRKSGGKSKG
jgi:hypothetical protein